VFLTEFTPPYSLNTQRSWHTSDPHRVTYTRGRIDTMDSPDDEHLVARNMLRIGINKYKKKNCASSWLFTKIASKELFTIPQYIWNILCCKRQYYKTRIWSRHFFLRIVGKHIPIVRASHPRIQYSSSVWEPWITQPKNRSFLNISPFRQAYRS